MPHLLCTHSHTHTHAHTHTRTHAHTHTHTHTQDPVTTVQLHAPNSVSLFLQVPMYVLITAGEVFFSITGLEFAYSQVYTCIQSVKAVKIFSHIIYFSSSVSPPQAPVSMKALCQAAWLWTVAFGNLIVIIIAEGRIFSNQASACIHLLYMQSTE